MKPIKMLSKTETRSFLLAVGIGCFAMALIDFVRPPTEIRSGRLEWVITFLHEHIGEYASSTLWAAVGTILLVSALSIRKQ